MGKYRSDANIELVSGMYLIFILTVMIITQIQVRMWMEAGAYVEDALALSALAASCIDVREYGMTHTVRIESPENAFEIFLESLKENLHLDEDMESADGNLIYGKTTVERFDVYNVEDGNVFIYSFGPDAGANRIAEGGAGMISTPDGTVVDNTSVYARVGFEVKGMMGMKIRAVKEKTVDIVGKPEG